MDESVHSSNMYWCISFALLYSVFSCCSVTFILSLIGYLLFDNQIEYTIPHWHWHMHRICTDVSIKRYFPNLKEWFMNKMNLYTRLYVASNPVYVFVAYTSHCLSHRFIAIVSETSLLHMQILEVSIWVAATMSTGESIVLINGRWAVPRRIPNNTKSIRCSEEKKKSNEKSTKRAKWERIKSERARERDNDR